MVLASHSCGGASQGVQRRGTSRPKWAHPADVLQLIQSQNSIDNLSCDRLAS